MKQTVSSVIDHIGIINLDLTTCKNIFLPLGFATGGITSIDTGISGETAPTNMHFVFDNAYIECIQSAPNDYLRAYLNSQAAMHTVVLSSGDIKMSWDSLKKAGYMPSDVMTASRSADHGDLKGQAIFNWVKLPDNTLPRTLLGVVEHTTKELIYQKNRYQHQNTAYAVKSIYMACASQSETAKYASDWRGLTDALSPHADGGHLIAEVSLMDSDSIQADWNMDIDAERSRYAGIEFLVKDLDVVREMAEKAGFIVKSTENGLILNFNQEIGLALLFSVR